MDKKESQATAERIGRRAVTKMTVFAVAFLVWQILYFAVFPDPGNTLRRVDIVRTVAFLVWSLALLRLFATGGAEFRPRDVRQYLDDERTRALRAAAYRVGFWTMIAICFAAYFATILTSLRAVDLAHVCLSAGVLSVLVSFVVLERR